MQLLGDAVAGAYLARNFSPEASAAARRMAEEFRAILRDRIGTVEWLGSASRIAAVAKLNETSFQIGYPDFVPDQRNVLSGLDVREGSAVRNQLAARRHATDSEMARVGAAIDRKRWSASNPFFPTGTYYSQNVLEISAAMLQPPFFALGADPAMNYGKIGQVIGHELTHAAIAHGGALGQGARAWTSDDIAAFLRRADLIVQQYDQYVIVDSIRQNGRRTLSENVGDIGGIALAWSAFESAIRDEPREIINGFTPEQRFFIAYAQGINTEVERPERYRTQAQVDLYSHSAAVWRVNGPLSHFAAFAAAFGCKEGDPMFRPTSLRWTVW
jgi:predicted metalloendopeptidase